jgi:SET domain-containing protein
VTNKPTATINRLPHVGVYTRLRPSKINGIGVFAIRKIKKGTYIFQGDDAEMAPVAKSRLRKLSKEIRKLYDDFAVIDKKRTYWCPKNFNVLTVGWYLNESKNPNVSYDKKTSGFFALRDIEADEELTADYDTYSERP